MKAAQIQPRSQAEKHSSSLHVPASASFTWYIMSIYEQNKQKVFLGQNSQNNRKGAGMGRKVPPTC